MAGSSRNRRWILLVLIALGVILIATLPRGATDDGEGDSDTARPSKEVREPAGAEGTTDDGGLATKRVIDGCDRTAEAMKYEPFVDRRALAILRWNNMTERAAKLKIPVYVTSVDDGAVGVSILPIPMRTQYLNIWMRSGHIERGPGDTFLLDPCASWIEAWEDMERTSEGNEAE